MNEIFSWIHLTDLHFGQENDWLWPSMQQEFFRDLKDMAAITGPWDIVFFSGDFVNHGDSKEYERLKKEFDLLWKHFRSLGSDPVLICVPGNHDLQRPGDTNPVTRQTHRWHQISEEVVKNEFWSDPKSQYRKAIDKAFTNYTGWLKSLKIPQPKLTKGVLPGDSSAIININSKYLGVVGLNSTFLQLGGGNYEGSLDLHIKQLHAVCNNKVAAWRSGVDLALLMTHQPPSWLHTSAKAHLSDIYALGKFDVHLAGHLHDPKLHDISSSGGPVRRLRQGASLFGLEKYGANETRPLFGYTIGRYEIDDSKVTETLWPRLAEFTRSDEVRRLGADRGSHLDTENKLRNTFGILPANSSSLRPTPVSTLSRAKGPSPHTPSESSVNSYDRNEFHFNNPSIGTNSKAIIKDVPHAKLKPEDHHRTIRSNEQQIAADLLETKHVLWLVTDWGLGKNGFLACAIEQFAGLSTAEVYTIQCGEATTCDHLQTLAETQFGLSFQEFFLLVAPHPTVVVVFDDLPTIFVTGVERSKLDSVILKPIQQFCQQLRIILVARQKPIGATLEDTVILKPLQVHETRDYLKKHPLTQNGLDDSETLDRVHNWSEGLPMRLDQLLEQLQIFSLSELLNEGLDYIAEEYSNAEPVPQALKEAVAQLQAATTTQSCQSFRLLKILAVLRDGEVFQSIRRFYPKTPFYFANVLELIQHNLLEAVPIAQTSAGLSHKPVRSIEPQADAPKLLRVPKQVRDYVKNIMSTEEREQILRDSTEVLFGKGWREGTIEMRKNLDASYRDSSLSGPGNEHVVAQYLLAEALHSNDDFKIRKAILLGLNFCNKLIDLDRFRDAAIASERMIHLLRDIGFNQDYAEAARLNGCALRMMDYDEAAIDMLKIALEYGTDRFSRSTQASIYLDIALAHDHLKQSQEAIRAANKVLELAQENSALAFHAKSVIVRATVEDSAENERELMQLLQSCRRRGHDAVANNIALDLGHRGKNLRDSLDRLDEVFKTAKGSYTRTRAIVQKASLLNQLGQSSKLTEKDHELLEVAYNYSYGQRIETLLERCHSVLWDILSKQGVWGSMLRLFRQSSFFWLLKGKKDRESKYIRQFDDLDVSELQRTVGRTIDDELLYLELRRRDHPRESTND